MNKFNWFVLCPVPKEQRPFYEYIKRKESNILGWVGLNESGYTLRFFITFLIVFSLNFPLTSLITNFFYYPFRALLINIILSLCFLLLLYTYFFVAWTYAGQRLLSAKVSYEESGWYDGKIWIKPPAILKHERLLYYYQLVPLITRLSKTIRLIFFILMILIPLVFILIY